MKKKKVVLHIEDDAEERAVLSRLLRAHFRYLGRDRAEEAEAVLAERDVHFIVLDLALPRMNGFEFLRKNRETLERRKIPVVLTTGVEGRGVRALGREYGCLAFLGKPLDHKALLDLIRRHLDDGPGNPNP